MRRSSLGPVHPLPFGPRWLDAAAWKLLFAGPIG